MKYTSSLLFLLAFGIFCPISKSQQSPMSASAGLGPGNSFTLFITFQNPMPKIENIQCAFQLQGDARPGQADFPRQLKCFGVATKDDETHYRVKVSVPDDVAAGDYKLDWITVTQENIAHSYHGLDLPNLAPVSVKDPKDVTFSPIKKLETKP